MEIQFNFDIAQKIFYKHYSGEVTYNDFESSWKDTIQNKDFPTDTKGFLLDYREATLAVSSDESNKIADFFLANLHVFGNKRIAFIVSTPEQIIIPMLINEFDFYFQSRPFSTVEAAKVWIIE